MESSASDSLPRSRFLGSFWRVAATDYEWSQATRKLIRLRNVL